mgnify:FL=1
MSLATRCTHCGTIFKVVQDQLKVSEGWVRCGRCNEVFNALPALFDLASEAPPPRPSTPSPTPPAFGAVARQPTKADLLADAPLNLGAPRATPKDDFDLDTSVSLRDVPAAVQPGGVFVQHTDDVAAPGPDSVPMTYEADALESRYLLPSSSRSRKAPVRRTQGPEFADAEFPMDAWLDAEDDWSLDVPPLPSTAPPSLARGHAAPASEPGPSAPAALPPHTDETTPSGLSVAERALAALATLPSAPPESAPEPEPEPVAASTPSKALPPSETPPAPPPMPADAPAADDLISTVPSRFADDDERPPHAEDQRPTTAIAPALTEAELLARHQRQARQKSRRPQADTPEFIRQAERQALWRNPGVRGVLTGLCLALSLTLAAQVAHQQRDWLAAHLPASKPWLTQWCSLAGCELRLLKGLDQLQVDHAALVRAESEGPDRYRLTLVVHNLARTELAWPAVDLVLNDANGVVMARRTLRVNDADWLAEAPVRATTGVRPPAAVGPAALGTLSWSLQLDDLTPAGYTAELFYPPDHP